MLLTTQSGKRVLVCYSVLFLMGCIQVSFESFKLVLLTFIVLLYCLHGVVCTYYLATGNFGTFLRCTDDLMSVYTYLYNIHYCMRNKSLVCL